jgi:hypothetical protein
MAILLLGAIILLVGSNIGAKSNALFARTQNTVATVDATNSQLRFTTWAGMDAIAPLITDCKQRVRPPRTGCINLFVNGDEVRISYDPDEPSNVWIGITPGGGKATILIALGITLLVGGALGFWWVAAKPWLTGLFHRAPTAPLPPGKSGQGKS